VDEYTIEHILPQNPNLSVEWKNALGPDWEHVQQAWLHTLGNLTLTGYNSEYSDRPYSEKRDMTGGFGSVRSTSMRDLGKLMLERSRHQGTGGAAFQSGSGSLGSA